MKAKDIRAGVVYAYGAHHRSSRLDAVLIVDIDHAQKDTLSGDVTFHAARVPAERVTDEVIKALAPTTPGGSHSVRVLAEAGMYADLVSHHKVLGPWGDVMAERERREAAIKTHAQRQIDLWREERQKAEEKHAATAQALAGLGIGTSMMEDDRGDYPGMYVIDQEQADKLIERLGQVPVDPTTDDRRDQ